MEDSPVVALGHFCTPLPSLKHLVWKAGRFWAGSSKVHYIPSVWNVPVFPVIYHASLVISRDNFMLNIIFMGFFYLLYSSSYSSAALEFEKEHKINPVYDSPRMSRRSLRLQTTSGFYGDNSFTELTGNHNVSSHKRTSTTTMTSSKVNRSDVHLSVSLR